MHHTIHVLDIKLPEPSQTYYFNKFFSDEKNIIKFKDSIQHDNAKIFPLLQSLTKTINPIYLKIN